ncbi:MAG TPA: hypothetical protein VL282_14105 [Tepidisphaeraceae bacterium]|nr:hypothetical protein [Tepidisphaeraceae bacterium]
MIPVGLSQLGNEILTLAQSARLNHRLDRRHHPETTIKLIICLRILPRDFIEG